MAGRRIKIGEKLPIFFFASKEVGLALDIWHSRKAWKCLLQNIYPMLELLYHKHNPLITTAVYGRIF